MIFQSTRPSRASTVHSSTLHHLPFHFNPQGPRGPRLLYSCGYCFYIISIHKALAGLDVDISYGRGGFVEISIHKALAGLDQDPQ